MSDQGFEAGASSQPSAGALLRAARERQGLHIAALAAAIKVAPRKLDALENDRWDELPDATFTRALAQTVCRTLKIDARPVLDLLPSGGPASLGPDGGGLNMPFRERSGRDEPGLGGAAIKPMIWGAALLMVVAIAVFLMPDNWWARAPAAQTPAAQASSGAGTTGDVVTNAGTSTTQVPVNEPVMPPTPAASGTLLIPETVTTAAAPEPVAAQAPAAPTPAAVVAAAPTTAPVAAPASTPAAVAAADPAASAGLVQLRTTAASWMEVRDGRNQILLSRTVQPGESVGLNGSLPIRLIIGNAAATRLAFRGQPVDLAAKTSNNVARVELQ